MTPEQLSELKEEMADTIRVVVNGKIDMIHKKFDTYIIDDSKWKGTVETFMTDMTPVKEGVHMLQTMNKFVKWLGLPTIGATIVYWFMK